MKAADLTKTPKPGRPLYKRYTVVGGALAAGSYFVDNQAFAPGTFGSFAVPHPVVLAIMCLGGLLVLFGIYRHITND